VNLDNETLIRAGAVVAAIALVAGQRLVDFAKATVQRVWKKAPVSQVVTRDDTHTVLEIARRLKDAGNTAGVALCQQLLDVMLNPKESKTK
jgi:pseudouridine-5'-phosphate glycosidase